jgi:hypothetical protein
MRSVSIVKSKQQKGNTLDCNSKPPWGMNRIPKGKDADQNRMEELKVYRAVPGGEGDVPKVGSLKHCNFTGT